MSDFRTIEIDIDVHKLIEVERANFSEAPNTVLRRLLGLEAHNAPPPQTINRPDGSAWYGKGVTLPHGTMLQMTYGGTQHSGKILNGEWVFKEGKFTSPSGAASELAVTKSGGKTPLNGWAYWEVKLPGETSWRKLDSLRSLTAITSAKGLEDFGL